MLYKKKWFIINITNPAITLGSAQIELKDLNFKLTHWLVTTKVCWS